MKKILIVIPSYSKGGGAEKILSGILSNGNFDGYDIDIVEIDKGKVGYENLPENISVIKNFNNEKYPKLIRLVLEQLGKKFPNLLRRYLIKKDDYDVEIMFEVMYPDIPFTKRDIEKIYWVHGSIEDFANTWREDRFRKYFLEATKIIAISNKTKRSIVELYPEHQSKIMKVYNGYNFEDILKKSREETDIRIEGKAICSIGRIDRKKGSDRTLELIKTLHERGFKYHMYYIGSGELEEDLKFRVQQYELSKYVHFLGYQRNPYKYLKKMKCLISMSRQEGFPGVYVEALSLGVPFVSTDVGGAEELSQGGEFGKIIFDNEEAIEEIIKFVENKSICNLEEINIFIQQLSIESQIKKFKELIDKT